MRDPAMLVRAYHGRASEAKQYSLRTTHVSPSVPRPMRGSLRRLLCSLRGAAFEATCCPREFSVFATQCRAGLTRVGNRVSVMISHARLLHLHHFMRSREISSATHTIARMLPPCTRMPFCIILCLALSCERCSNGTTLSNPVSCCGGETTNCSIRSRPRPCERSR